MKKLVFIGIVLTTVLFATKAFGQPLITETFEDYTVGAKLVQQAKMFGYTHWTTWDGSAGGATDATITTAQVQEGVNAAQFAKDNDVILLLGDQVSGAYTVTFYMYVPTGQTGYFNILHKVPGSPGGHEWAAEIYFTSGVATIYAGSSTAQNIGSFPQATWVKIGVDVDLDEDQASLAINDDVRHTWQFSLTSTGSGLKQLGGIDFYGGETGSIFDYYIDNIVFEQVSDPLPPPIVTIIPDDIVKQLLSGDAGNTSAQINNEGEGTQDAIWYSYIKYPDLDYGTEATFDLTLCDEYSVYSDGMGGIGYTTTTNYIIEMAMRLTPADYKTKLGGEITDVAYFVYAAPHAPVGDITFRVYGQGPDANSEGEILAEQVLPKSNFVYDAWNSITLDESVKLTGGEYWVAVEFEAYPGADDSFPMALDGGPLKWGGDWDRLNHGPWSRLSETSTFPYNYAIKASGSGKVRDAFVVTDKTTGITKPGDFTPVTFMFDSGTYPDGNYEATFIVHSNDEINPVIEVPILMIVGEGALNTNANIGEITVNDIVAVVQSNELEYQVTVPCTDKIFIVATAEDEAAEVTGDLGEFEVKCLTANNYYTITVTAEDGETVKVYNLKVLVDKDDPPAISEIDNTIKLFPNPVSDYLYITSEYTIETITIYDLTGKVVKQVKQPGTSVNLSDLAAGYYMLKVTTEQGDTMHKFVKE